jgi:DNA-binding LytR/AlgR family response regulator
MRILIVEDEPTAAGRLRHLIGRHMPDGEVLACTESVRETAQWLIDQGMPDLIFMDIQLADGLSFELFGLVEITCPIIFTTAYDEYALRAFKVNSVDYLLKPFDGPDLERAVKKYRQLFGQTGQPSPAWHKIRDYLNQQSPAYRNRFVLRIGEHIRSLPVQEISHLLSREKTTFAITNEKRQFILDHSLDQVESMLDPRRFFRISRRYIVSMEAIQDIVVYSGNRLRLKLKTTDDMDLLVSREKVAAFRQWLEES